MKHRFTLLLPLLILIALFLAWVAPPEKRVVSVVTHATSAKPATPMAVTEFRDWSQRQRSGTIAAADLAKGIELAAARKQVMAGWIANNPAMALENAVSWSEYEALPAEMKPFIEQPFNTVGSLRVLPVCDPSAGPETLRVLEIDGKTWDASVFGRRIGHGTKESTPLAGITLDGRAAVSDAVFEILTPADAKTLARLPLGNRDARRDFATGRPLGEQPVTALAGGRRFLFENTETIAAVNEKLSQFDETPGPHGGSRQLFVLADAGDGSVGINWEQAGELVQMEADSWTETDKDVFFIRVDFPDKTGAEASQATLSAVLNGPVADSIDEMSYGKTTILGTVSAEVIRMPSNSSAYLADYNALHDDAVAGYKAIHGATSLSGYDIIGVHFKEIGYSWAGLATLGGSRQWIEGNTITGTIIHEFGHNYGVGHASFWQTSDSSVVGTGGSVEYGDIFDIMGDGPDPEGHFHMQAKQKLNWLDATKWTDATASGSGTYRIYRFDHPSTTGTRRGVRVTKAASPAEYYWLGYRPGIPNNPMLEKGAYLLWQYPGQTRSWLLDTTPDSAADSTADREDAAITLGKTYSDTTAGVHFTPLATGGFGADAWIDVSVQIGAFPGNAAPTATLTVPAGATARTPLVFSVSASDPNGDALAYSWNFGDSTVSNSSASVSHSWTVGGTYSVSVTVSDMKGGHVTKTQSVTVSDPLNSWTQRTSGTTANLKDITYGGGKLVAVGDAKGTYRVSSDGTNWTGGVIWVSGNTANNLTLEGVIHDGSQFVAAGYDYNFSAPVGWTGAIYTSPNGTTWTRRNFSGPELRDIAYGGGTYIAVGETGTIWKSTNGTSWTLVPSGVTLKLHGVAYGNNSFVAVGWGGSGAPVVLTSSNGTSWTNTTPGSGIGAIISGEVVEEIEYCHDRFLTSSQNINIRYSTNGGATFQDSGSVPKGRAAFAYGNGVFFSAGVDRDNSNTAINLLSTNGANWTAMTPAPQANRNAAVFFNNTFITVGDSGLIWQSNTFTAPVTGGYASWLALNFPGNPPLSGPADDFDRDGIPNLGEYATGTDPRNAGARVNLTTAVTGGYFTLTVPKDPTGSDVTVRVESSTDLLSWSTAGTTVLTDNPGTLSVRLNTPVSSTNPGRGFLRVVFDQTE